MYILLFFLQIVQTSLKSKGLTTKLEFKRRNLIKRKTRTDHFNLTTDATPITNNKNHSSSNNTLDKDLYEINVEKEGNIQERSFIYIKQKFKKPYIKNAFEVMNKNNKTYKNNKNKVGILPHSFLNEIMKKQYADANEIINQSTFEIQNDEQTGDKAISIETDRLAMKEGVRDDYIDEIIRELLGEQVTQTKRKFLERKLNICQDCGKKKKMQSFYDTPPIDNMCLCRLKKSGKVES